MAERKQKPLPPPRGRVTINSTSADATGITIELGYGRGAITLHLGSVSGGTDDERLRWKDRPGNPVSVAEPEGLLGYDKDYLAHAKLDLRTGEIYPGWQSS